jgi:hypothetical protein
VDRALFNLENGDDTEEIPFSNPTAVAVGVLWAGDMTHRPLFDSFIESGGIPAVVHLLSKSTCPVTLRYCGNLIGDMLDSQATSSGQRNKSSMELADKFFQAGETGLHTRHLPRQRLGKITCVVFTWTIAALLSG